jgi:hypothetical protein
MAAQFVRKDPFDVTSHRILNHVEAEEARRVDALQIREAAQHKRDAALQAVDEMQAATVLLKEQQAAVKVHLAIKCSTILHAASLWCPHSFAFAGR